jgi:hypothetical protein
VDESTIGNVGIELENDPSGLWWTLVLVPGSQKVRGSNPLGSTKSVSGGSDWAFALRLQGFWAGTWDGDFIEPHR